MKSAYLLALAALTSAAAYMVGRRWSARASLGPALRRVLEWAGFWAIFYALNLAMGFVAILVIRKVTGTTVSLYVNTDATLSTLSALQATAWQWWRAEGKAGT